MYREINYTIFIPNYFGEIESEEHNGLTSSCHLFQMQKNKELIDTVHRRTASTSIVEECSSNQKMYDKMLGFRDI